MLVPRSRLIAVELQLAEAVQARHTAELRAIRAETLADVRALEIERLERLLTALPGAPVVGGFLPFDVSEPESPSEQPIASSFMARLSEVTNGLSLEEAESRWVDHRQQQVAALQAEQADIRAELKTLQELDES